jgi:hypothetical protein
VWIAAGVLFALVLILHRPLIFAIGHRVAAHLAARENLKAEFHLEGNPFGALTIRNVHVFPTGPSDVESIDADFIHVDYGLFTLIRHGLSAALNNVDVRSATVVLNPSKAPLRPRPPNPKHKISLPDIFPERVHLSDVNLTVRNQPHDFVLEHLDLDLHPKEPGELKFARLQLVGGQVWLRVAAQTSYTNRNLVLHNVVLANDEQISSLSVDASQIADRKLAIQFEYNAGEGHLSGHMALREDQLTLDTKVDLDGVALPLAFINKYSALPENFIQGDLKTLKLNVSGLLSSPKTWNGTLVVQINNFRQENTAVDRADFRVKAQNGSAQLESADLVEGENQLHVRGTVELPRSVDDFGRTETTIELAGTAPDLSEVTAHMTQKVSGSAQINGTIDIHDARVNGSFSVAAGALGFADGAIERVNANIKLSKIISPPESKKPWFTDLQSETSLAATNVRSGDYAADSVEATLHSVNDVVIFERALVRRKQNEFNLTGEYRLPEDLGKISTQPAKINATLNAPQLADYWVNETGDRIEGPLQLSGQVEWLNGLASGQFTVFGTDLRARDLVVHELSVQGTIADSVVYLNDLTATLNQQDFVGGNGIFDSRPPYRYRGKLTANLADLAVFNPLVKASGNKNTVEGSLIFDWNGDGSIRGRNNSGNLKLKLEKGRYGQLQSLEANVEAAYSPDGFNVPIAFFRNDKMDFQAIAQTRADRLEIDKIQLNQGTQRYADGFISIPFVWKNIGANTSPFPGDGAVSAAFQTQNLDIKKVFEDIGLKPPATGTINVKLDASGTLSQLQANLGLQMRDVRTDKMPKLEPANVDLTAEARDGQLNVTGNLKQPKIQPVTLTANFPFRIEEILKERKIPDNSPVNAQIRMPRSSVNFVRQFVPAIATLDGDLALDVGIKGTIAQPVLSGSSDMTINVGRFTNPTFPPLQNFKAHLVFNNDTLSLERFGGELAGGPFAVSGRVTFPRLTQPNLDMQLKANSVLVARNDSLTARADADVRVSGPLTSASVNGKVALTNSHFLKNLDLIPIGLPGRPAPEPPASRPQFSIPDPPLRDWKFDVAIKTKDPFLIRGSLANGGAIIDLHLGGTGLRPLLDGQVRLENVEATLPFSRLDVQYGFLYFDPSDPFNPKIDLHGSSVIRDYTIHVFVFGRSLSPEAIFSSEPPLPQEDIISLLATGTTREELTGNNNVLAGRAAMLLFQQLYHKVFKTGESTNSSSVFDRLDVDFGQVDPRTGQQTATARFKVNQQIVLVGDIEVGGDFRGMVKYLIRFH